MQGRGGGFVGTKSQDWTRICILKGLTLLRIYRIFFFKDCIYFLKERG